MTQTRLHARRDGTVLRLTLEGTDGNLFSPDLALTLADTLSEAADDGARVAVIRGAGGRFCRGWDTAALAAWDDGERLTGALQAVAAAPLPVIAVLEGDVYGGGLALALLCDVRLAAADARLGFPDEAAAGWLPAGGSVARLARLAGRGVALHALLTGEPLDAAHALVCGLVTGVYPGRDLPGEADRLAAVIAGRGPIAARYAKEVVARGMEMPLEPALRYETDVTVILQSTADRAEGVRAFIEKRPPQFHGE